MIKDILYIKEELERLGKILDNGNPSPEKYLAHTEGPLALEEQSTIRMKEGDRNTNFFHRYENYRRKINLIWHV